MKSLTAYFRVLPRSDEWAMPQHKFQCAAVFRQNELDGITPVITASFVPANCCFNLGPYMTINSFYVSRIDSFASGVWPLLSWVSDDTRELCPQFGQELAEVSGGYPLTRHNGRKLP